MTLRYICDRCDTRADTALGHHLCETQTNREINEAVASASGAIVAWLRVADSFETSMDALGPHALARGYRFTLTQFSADEYRVSFFHNVDTVAATAMDRSPARAFARAWLRLPKESEGAA